MSKMTDMKVIWKRKPFIKNRLLRIALILSISSYIAGPASMIGASNFFELAVAIAISLFGAP